MLPNLSCEVHLHSKGGATDRYGFKIKLYKDVRSVLKDLGELGIPLAAASRYVRVCIYQDLYGLVCVYLFCVSQRTEDPPASRELLRELGIDKCFKQLEIFPGSKFTHFEK